MLNTALTFTGWLHKDDTIRLVQDKRSSTFTLWPFYATFWGGEKLHPSWRGILERRGMRLLYHVLPGSGMFEESGRAWHCACPEPFLQFWAMWWWERPAACGPQLAFPRMSWAEWGLFVGDAPYPAQSWQEQPQCLSLSIMAKMVSGRSAGCGQLWEGGWLGQLLSIWLVGWMHVSPPCTAITLRCPRPWCDGDSVGGSGPRTQCWESSLPLQAQHFSPVLGHLQQG